MAATSIATTNTTRLDDMIGQQTSNIDLHNIVKKTPTSNETRLLDDENSNLKSQAIQEL